FWAAVGHVDRKDFRRSSSRPMLLRRLKATRRRPSRQPHRSAALDGERTIDWCLEIAVRRMKWTRAAMEGKAPQSNDLCNGAQHVAIYLLRNAAARMSPCADKDGESHEGLPFSRP